MKTPKISVIIPTHCRPDFLRRAILSIQNQRFTDFELIVVADRCPYSRKVYETFEADERIRFFEISESEHEFNNGCDGRRKGIKEARSDIIAYLDDDDIMLPNCLKTLYPYIANGEYDYVVGNIINVSYKEEIIENNKNFSVILKNNLYKFPRQKDESKVAIKRWALSAALHTKDLLDKCGGWILDGNAVGRLMNEFKEKGRIKEIDNILGIIHAYGGSRKSQRNSFALKDYQNRLKEMPEEAVFTFDIRSKDWYDFGQINMIYKKTQELTSLKYNLSNKLSEIKNSKKEFFSAKNEMLKEPFEFCDYIRNEIIEIESILSNYFNLFTKDLNRKLMDLDEQILEKQKKQNDVEKELTELKLKVLDRHKELDMLAQRKKELINQNMKMISPISAADIAKRKKKLT